MAQQKQAVIDLVASHRSQGRTVGEVLGGVGVSQEQQCLVFQSGDEATI